MQRLTRMDGARGLLASYVMVGHALPFTALPGWVQAPFSHGGAAVDLFFCLSGLVIAHSLERHQGRFYPFIAARAQKLLPSYFIVLLLACVLLAAGNPLGQMPWVGATGRDILEASPPPHFWAHVAAHVVLLQGMIPQPILPYAYVTLLGPAWSLSTEWQFYLLIGLLAPRKFGLAAIGMLALGYVYRLLPGGLMSRAFIGDAAPYFALGLATYQRFTAGRSGLFWLCLALATLAGALQGPEKALAPLAWGWLVLAQRHTSGAWLEAKPLQFLGAVSYPLYLLNEPVQRLLALLLAPLARGNAPAFTALWLAPALLLPLLAAAALHYGFERRFMAGNKNFAPVIARAPAE